MAFSLRKVLISDDISKTCVDILTSHGIEAVLNTKLSKTDLLTEIADYDGLIVRSATKVTSEVIQAGKRLKVIGRAGTGVDNIDTSAATRQGVLVMNTPQGNTLSAAELTCTMVCSLSRHIPQACMSMREGKWERKQFMGSELSGKTLAIVGLGRIGKEVASRMQAFGMTTIGYDPITPAEVAASWGVEWMSLEEVWKRADYITVHTPLLPQTENLVSTDSLAKCKKGVRIINCARGGIVDEAALLQALNSGQCGGAALDVFVDEPPKNLELVKHPMVISTPHLGASTVEAQERVAEEIAQQFVDLSCGLSLVGAINGQAVGQAISKEITPWVTLASTFGRMAACEGIKEVSITARGCIFAKASYLQAAVSSGILHSKESTALNLVNSPILAKEAGITVAVSVDKEDCASVSITLSTSNSSLQLTGTVCSLVPMLTDYAGSRLSSPISLVPGSYLLVGQSAALFSSLSEITAYSATIDKKTHIFSTASLPSDKSSFTVFSL